MATDDRLQRLLGGTQLHSLRLRLRLRYQRTTPDASPRTFRIERLSTDEHAALAALLGRPARFAASMQVDVAALDSALRQAGIADSLRAALERLDGRIVDRVAEQEALQLQWRRVIDECADPGLAGLLQTPAGTRLLKRVAGSSHETAARSLAGAQAVLCRLPAGGLTRAQLAADVLGDAHALDAGCAAATLVLAVLRAAAGCVPSVDAQALEPDAPSARDLWAGAGVLVNELARPALFLNLPVAGGDPGRLGEPAYLSLRSLLRSPPTWSVGGRSVFVCENPNLLASAAEHLGARCAPLVCTDGMPAAAQRSLLNQLAEAGAVLRYHGDFDWPGLRIGTHVMRRHHAQPWRFGADDYLDALRFAPQPGRGLHGAEVDAFWDAALAAAMRSGRRAIDEEMVAQTLLEDLATTGTGHRESR